MNRLKFFFVFFSVVFMAAQSSWATTAYVSDSFEITCRTGPSLENKIIAMPSSGQPLEIMDSQDEWTKVRMKKPDGTNVDGWVLNRYLITRLPWKTQAEELQAKNVSLREKLADTEKRLKAVSARQQDLVGKLRANSEALEHVRTEYDSLRHRAADYLKLEAAYETNRSKLETAEARVSRLTEEIKQLRLLKRNRWLLTGAVVVLIGLLIGMVLGRQQRKHRSY
ncbi:MAG: TIGR04211 family SH3 domain-containing protein [Thermodesulfobacteriota bacterium]